MKLSIRLGPEVVDDLTQAADWTTTNESDSAMNLPKQHMRRSTPSPSGLDRFQSSEGTSAER
jgi:hypothetical protein